MKIGTFVMVTGAVIVGMTSLLTANAAQARVVKGTATPLDSLNGCPAHSFCIWNGTGFSGAQWTWTYQGNGGTGQWLGVGPNANDLDESLVAYRTWWTLISDNNPPNGVNWGCLEGVTSLPDLDGKTYYPGSAPIQNTISAFALTSSTNVLCP